MAKAIHVKCEHAEAGKPRNSRPDRLAGTWWSGFWDISEDEARSLVGGWIYLHSTKAKTSYFGGEIVNIKSVICPEFPRSERIEFEFRPSNAAKGQKWRGQKYMMAHKSVVDDANLPHEVV